MLLMRVVGLIYEVPIPPNKGESQCPINSPTATPSSSASTNPPTPDGPSSCELIVNPYNADNSDSDQPTLDELVSLREAAELSGLSASHLRLLASRGDIWGMKLGRDWVTTAQAVEEYLAEDRRPGPKPKQPQT